MEKEVFPREPFLRVAKKNRALFFLVNAKKRPKKKEDFVCRGRRFESLRGVFLNVCGIHIKWFYMGFVQKNAKSVFSIFFFFFLVFVFLLLASTKKKDEVLPRGSSPYSYFLYPPK